MATTSIIINSTDTLGKAAQKAMPNVNPDATNAELVTLGQMITAAQNHTYQETYRINKENCDLEQSVAKKPVPTITLTLEIESFSGTYSGDGTLHAIGTNNSTPPVAARLDSITVANGAFEFALDEMENYEDVGELTHLVVYAAETDNFAAAVAVWNRE